MILVAQIRRVAGMTLAAVALAAPLMVVACSSSASNPASAPAAGGAAAPAAAAASGAAQEVKLTVKEFSYEPKELKLIANKPVKLTLENKGQLDHDLVIEGLKVKVLAKPGATESVTFTPEKAGSYDYECSVVGHKDAGMKGKVTVQ